MGACASRGVDPAPEGAKSGSFGKRRDLSFEYEGRTATTTVGKGTALGNLNAFLLSAFGLDEATHVVTGVLVTVAGPLMPFFMSSFLPANEKDRPYRVVVAPLKDFAMENWGRAPDAQEQADATVEWSEVAALADEDPYASPASAVLASCLVDRLRRYGYLRLRLPAGSPLPATFRAATAAAQRFFALPEHEKRQRFLGFNQRKFVGFSHAMGSARQFIQLRTTRGKITTTNKAIPEFTPELTMAYLALQGVAYQLFRLLCHPVLTPQTHLAPALYSSLLDAPCSSPESFLQCESVPGHQFVGTNVFRVYQYLRDLNSASSPPPGFLGAATSVHSDMGLLTVSPQSNLPGLTLLKHSDATRWVNVEMEMEGVEERGEGDQGYVFVFAGETLAQLTKGYLVAPLHFVDERTPTVPRFSMPFFLRARQREVLPAVEGFCQEMTVEHFMTQVLHEWKQVWGHKPTTDY